MVYTGQKWTPISLIEQDIKSYIEKFNKFELFKILQYYTNVYIVYPLKLILSKLFYSFPLILSVSQFRQLRDVFFFLAHLAKGHVSFCHHLASVVRRKLSHLNLLRWNPWTKLNQTWQGWSLGGSLSKLCLTDPPSFQDGCCC